MKFAKGKSGNPAGRPKAATLEEIRAIARRAAPEMVETLLAIARSSDSDRAKAAAANAVLDRAYGKPAQMLADADGNSINWMDFLLAARSRFQADDHGASDTIQ
jgi:hypothetical protein